MGKGKKKGSVKRVNSNEKNNIKNMPNLIPDNDNEVREFDLNIEKILENWEVCHAVREIIANALDEQQMTGTRDIRITQDKIGWWHITDYGRGLNYHHLTQNENTEKLNSDNLIGKFGVGLKDALATLYRNDVKVMIKSCYGVITLKEAVKSGFKDVITLHANIAPPENKKMAGTDFCLYGCTGNDMDKAKSMFLKYNNTRVLETTEYGQVLLRDRDGGTIYMNGIKVASEPNFMFSYNITSLTKSIKDLLNRERINVGRKAYMSRVRDILKRCTSEMVIESLVNDMKRTTTGNRHDEVTWTEVSMYVAGIISRETPNAVFVSVNDCNNNPGMIEGMKLDGLTPIMVDDKLITRINNNNNGADTNGIINTANEYVKKDCLNFNPVPTDINTLTPTERSVYEKTNDILRLIGGKPINVKDIIIADSIYDTDKQNVQGAWVKDKEIIVIRRSELLNIMSYAGTLIHECCHAVSGADDATIKFENKLTDVIGYVVANVITKTH